MADTPTICFWGGLGTIGGTKVVIQDAGYRVMLDFGLAYAPGEDYYDQRLRPQPETVLSEYLALGYAPPLPGLYHPALPDGGAALPAGPARGPADTAVFISHLHLDHCALIDLIAPGIPVYMHAEAVRMALALRAINADPTVGPARDYRPFEWEMAVQVGPMRVTPLAVDHDIPGASGFLVETRAGTVAFTGDLRCHGAHPDRTAAFVARARAAQPLALIIEGTRLGEAERGSLQPPVAEPELAPRLHALLNAGPVPAFISLYPRNVERITALATAAQAAGRTLALAPASAELYARCGGALSAVALYLTATERTALAQDRAPAWLATFAGEADIPVVGATEVAAEPGHWLAQLTYPGLGELASLRPGPGALFIHAGGEPLGRFDPAFARMEMWLRRFGVTRVGLSATGHASPGDLQQMAADIAPRVLIPVHSLRPELLQVPGMPRLLPEHGAVYRLDEVARGCPGATG